MGLGQDVAELGAFSIGSNEAPIVVMIEHYRTELVWKNFMQSPAIKFHQDKIATIREK